MGASQQRYGPWAVIAGASEGIGAAFAQALAEQGFKLLLLARREGPLETLAATLRATGAEVRTAAVDVGASTLGATLGQLTQGLEVGLLVYNAAFSPVGPFLERPLEAQLQAVDVNVRGTLQAVSALAPAMVARGKGGIILLSSLTAFQGSPWVSTYGGTKAFLLSFGEGLWAELKEKGVDVLVSCAGATATPGLLAQSPQGAPFMLPPRAVADDALGKLGHGPTTIPGAMNRLASFFMQRLLPRRMTVQLMSSQTKKLKSA